MPRFYFNLCNGAEFTQDEEGDNLPDYAAARRNAVRSLRDVMAGDVLSGTLNTAAFIEIEDEQHMFVEAAHFLDAIRIREERSCDVLGRT